MEIELANNPLFTKIRNPSLEQYSENGELPTLAKFIVDGGSSTLK